MDGTLCYGIAWTVEDVPKMKPRLDVIEKVNKLALEGIDGHPVKIMVWTARRDELIPATLEWLRKHDVRFWGISNNKIAAELYIDDRAINVEDWLKQ